MNCSDKIGADKIGAISKQTDRVHTVAAVTATAAKVVDIFVPGSSTVASLAKDTSVASTATNVVAVSTDVTAEAMEGAKKVSIAKEERSCCSSTSKTAASVGKHSNRVAVAGIVVSGLAGVVTVAFPPSAPVTVPLIIIANTTTKVSSTVSGVAVGTELASKGAMALRSSEENRPVQEKSPYEESDACDEEPPKKIDKSHRYGSWGLC